MAILLEGPEAYVVHVVYRQGEKPCANPHALDIGQNIELLDLAISVSNNTGKPTVDEGAENRVFRQQMHSPIGFVFLRRVHIAKVR